jgi:hypothetical protein
MSARAHLRLVLLSLALAGAGLVGVTACGIKGPPRAPLDEPPPPAPALVDPPDASCCQELKK